jgi:glyoxylase-like metal-dependent hydrolase (beta-lactamase superfamily II)
VLTTHGHPYHVGNNDLADELGVPVEHFVPARDLDQMRDPSAYWTRSMARLAGVVPLPAPPAGNKVVSLFQPLRPFASATRTYEERPLEQIRIGSARGRPDRASPGPGPRSTTRPPSRACPRARTGPRRHGDAALEAAAQGP